MTGKNSRPPSTSNKNKFISLKVNQRFINQNIRNKSNLSQKKSKPQNPPGVHNLNHSQSSTPEKEMNNAVKAAQQRKINMNSGNDNYKIKGLNITDRKLYQEMEIQNQL